MKLDVKELLLEKIGQSEQVSVEFFKEQIDQDVLAERVKGNLKLTKLESEILAEFDGKAMLKLLCDRCLSEYQIELPLKFKQIYVTGIADLDESRLSVDKNSQIDILEPIRQEILVSLPIKKLCKTDCAGICPACGKNLNVEKCSCKSQKQNAK